MLMLQSDRATQRRNSLLETLEGDDRRRLLAHASHADIDGGQCVSTLAIGAPIVCFPLSLVASMAQVTADGRRFDVGLIGSEGMIGWSAVLGDASQSQAAIAQVGGGETLMVSAPIVADLCGQSATLHAALLAFVHSFAMQMSHTIVATLRDGVERRLARWLLMLHDRVDGDVLAMTHGDLAAALHVRRASITDTLHILEGDRIVRCTRGQLVIRDRAALTAIAGDSYGLAEASYRALIGDFGKRA